MENKLPLENQYQINGIDEFNSILKDMKKKKDVFAKTFNDLKYLLTLGYIPFCYYNMESVYWYKRGDKLAPEVVSFLKTNLAEDDSDTLTANTIQIYHEAHSILLRGGFGVFDGVEFKIMNKIPSIVAAFRKQDYEVCGLINGKELNFYMLVNTKNSQVKLVTILLDKKDNLQQVRQEVFPEVVLREYVDLLSRQTNEEREFVKEHNLLSQRELNEVEAFLFNKEDNPFKWYRYHKTLEVENYGLLESYYKYLSDNNLEETMENLIPFIQEAFKEANNLMQKVNEEQKERLEND